MATAYATPGRRNARVEAYRARQAYAPEESHGHAGTIFLLLGLGGGGALGVWALTRNKTPGSTTPGGGVACTPPVGSLVGDAAVGPVAGSRIWLVVHDSNGQCQRRWIANEYAFNSCDYAWVSIMWLPTAEIEAIPEGTSLDGFPDCPPATLKPPSSCVIHVTVQAGDTLPGLVQTHYGQQYGNPGTPVPYFISDLIWEALYAVNAQVIEAAAVAHGLVNSNEGGNLFAGTVLCLPALGGVTPH